MTVSSRSDIITVSPSDVSIWVSTINTSTYFQVAILTVLVYDTVITMDKEVKYFWGLKRLRKAVTITFFANRYIGILGATANITCNLSEWTRTASNWITVVSIDYILMLRVLALYSQGKRLKSFLMVLLILEAMMKLGISIYINVIQDVIVGALAKGVTVCGDNNNPPLAWGILDWIIPLVYGLLLMALALYKAAEFWRMSAGFKGLGLVNVLVQDQAIYFMLVVLCCLFNIMDYKIDISESVALGILDALGSPTFLCILGSRMFFNIKEAGERGLNEGTSYRVRSRKVSEMDFA